MGLGSPWHRSSVSGRRRRRGRLGSRMDRMRDALCRIYGLMWTCMLCLATDGRSHLVSTYLTWTESYLLTAATGRYVQRLAVPSAFSRSQSSIEESAPPDNMLASQVSFTALVSKPSLEACLQSTFELVNCQSVHPGLVRPYLLRISVPIVILSVSGRCDLLPGLLVAEPDTWRRRYCVYESGSLRALEHGWTDGADGPVEEEGIHASREIEPGVMACMYANRKGGLGRPTFILRSKVGRLHRIGSLQVSSDFCIDYGLRMARDRRH